VKITLREEVGSAINAGDLRGRVLSTLNAFAVGSDRLGEALWRLKYGNDNRQSIRRAAVVIITHQIHGRRGRHPSARLVLLVECALQEWLEDRCPECRGRRFTGTEYGDPKATRENCPSCFGKKSVSGIFDSPQERMLNRVSCQRCGGRGWITGMQVDASKTQTCRTCEGMGRIRRSPGSRALAIGIDRVAFQRGWSQRYDRALEIMRASDRVTGRTVASAMRSLHDLPGMELLPEEEVEQWMREHARTRT
jgi:hypothetical protein